jgi:hypothetical protein
LTPTRSRFTDDTPLAYDFDAVDRYRRSINWIAGILAAFKGRLREGTSPVEVFPHHFDLAMNWFSGRLVPGVDPNDEESADEQMNFGFVTGDDSIDNADFYVTAYHQPEGWTDLDLPDGAYWQTGGWTGAILPYAALIESREPGDELLAFMQTVHAHGAALWASWAVRRWNAPMVVVAVCPLLRPRGRMLPSIEAGGSYGDRTTRPHHVRLRRHGR